MKRLAVLFSGGTDSTAATALVAPEYDRLHLLTYRHSGLAHVENSRTNLMTLQTRFGRDKFTHEIFDIDKLFKAATYADYLSGLRRYGFFALASCGFCKLAMHVRTIVYCLDNAVTEAADGANVNMSHFPAQMKEVLEPLRDLYAQFGIRYTNPVFEYDYPENLAWFDKLGLRALTGETAAVNPGKKGTTTGQLLFEQGILPAANVKGTDLDRRMQARCFQLTLLNLFALGSYIPKHGMEKYRLETASFFREKLDWFRVRLEEYQRRGNDSELARWINR